MKQFSYTVNKKILTLALAGLIMVSTSCLMYLYNPLQLIIEKLMAMEPGTVFFKLWQAPPYAPIFKVYIFNVTNPDAFLRGKEKLKVAEIGPYCYTEKMTNYNATFNEEDSTFSYIPIRDTPFDRECSIGDAMVDRILVPNIPLLGIQSYLIDSAMITAFGFSTLSATLGAQAFVNVSVHEYLWGYTDKLVTMANDYIPSWIDFDTFGIVERLLSRDNNNKVTIVLNPEKRKSRYSNILSEQELNQPFHIVKWNGIEGLPEWGYDSRNISIEKTKKCQLVEGGYDGTIFPRMMNKTNITLFRKAFCRPVVLEFVEEGYTKQGFRSFNYKMPSNMFESPEKNENNECFCYNGECPGKGLQTIAPCYYGIPIVLSQPHFLNSPPEIVNSIIGMNPVKEKHNSLAKIQPDIGIPLDESALRIQVNLGVGKTKYNSRTRPFNGLTVPILWFELTCDRLPSLISFLLTLVLDVLPVTEKVLTYLLGLLGLAFISGAALLTLFFTKTSLARSLSIPSEYSPVPLITIPAQYFKEKELRICK